MNRLPIDTARMMLIATGKVTPKPEYAKLADGSATRTGAQASNDRGMALYVIDVLPDDDLDEGRSEVLGVTVASPDRPQVQKFRPVQFVGLTAVVYRDRMTGQPRMSFSAEGIVAAAAPKVAS